MTLPGLAVLALLVATASVGAAEENTEQRPRDAAETVREGDVSQWLKYYQRERGAASEPARNPPASTPQDLRPRPLRQSAAPKR